MYEEESEWWGRRGRLGYLNAVLGCDLVNGEW